MKRTTLTNHMEAFKSEALMLLRFQLAANRLLDFEDINRINRSRLVDRILAVKAIENDIVIRLCKLDDNTKGVHSFPKALREVSQEHPNRDIIEKEIENFSEAIERIKKERRHTQLAHLKIGDRDEDYEPRYDFTSIIRFVVKIIDLMNKENVSYRWSDGKYEKYNLRKEVFDEEE